MLIRPVSASGSGPSLLLRLRC